MSDYIGRHAENDWYDSAYDEDVWEYDGWRSERESRERTAQASAQATYDDRESVAIRGLWHEWVADWRDLWALPLIEQAKYLPSMADNRLAFQWWLLMIHGLTVPWSVLDGALTNPATGDQYPHL